NNFKAAKNLNRRSLDDLSMAMQNARSDAKLRRKEELMSYGAANYSEGVTL
ncbi:unnamed protein product, partial [Ceratitis capitata]